MDKNAIKRYAVWARNELIARVTQKAEQYEITEKKITFADADSIGGRLLMDAEKKQRAALIEKIQTDGFEQVMEEVAYTWFNRFTALRFMEVNNYLPSHTRVFTNEAGEFKPQILADAIQMELDGLDMDKVFEMKDANKNEELYKYLLIVQCNALSTILPRMFQKIEHYTELLLPDYLLREGSVIEQMIALIPEEDWTDQVQIIGWLYQYYNSEPKDMVFAALKKNVKISKENIPAATQLFTPDWIVRYMVENSLGRLWLEGHPNDALKSQWKYYLDEAEQEADVQKQLDEIRKEYAELKPEEIRCIDPCMGSGHILCYMFDVLVKIYEDYGYTAREAVGNIVEKNLWGLDIDERAAQLSYFAVMMKARQYDRRFFFRGIQPNVYAPKGYAEGEKFGSLLTVEELETRPKEPAQMMLFDEDYETQLNRWNFRRTLAQKYHVVCTNPPYMGASNMNGTLAEFVKKNFPNSKSDLFSCFMEQADLLVKRNYFTSLITMESWMFLSSFEKLREKINQTKTIINMVHMPYLGKGGTSLGINFGTAAVVMQKERIIDYSAQYEYTVYYECDDNGIPIVFPTKNERWKTAKQSDFSKISGSPVAYWVSEAFFNDFVRGEPIGKISTVSEGIKTGNNDLFLRLWYEVNLETFSCALSDHGYKWYPHHKGGEYRKWYGNLDWIINWANDGQAIKNVGNSGLQGKSMYFRSFSSWSKISSKGNPFRFYEKNCLFDSGAPSISNDYLLYTTALFNTKVGAYFLNVVSPTLNLQVGDVKSVPLIVEQREIVEAIVQQNISLSHTDWDSFETSWDFQCHPLIPYGIRGAWDLEEMRKAKNHSELPQNLWLSGCYEFWEKECQNRFNQLKTNEEELNRIFMEIYGLQDEMTPEVEDKDVTVRKANLQRDIRSLLSYAVGCMFGRYSLNVPGLAYAGGEWDTSKYEIFQPDKDAIIPICDDEYFEDDIVSRFVKFIEVVYGKETLEENLLFISQALGGKGTSREVIRNYFINDFFADHCRIYQKRPIYWLFNSGKKNGFKCLVYMHRYRPDTIARIRTDYVHEQQSRYRTAIADLENRINGADTSERVKLNKQLSVFRDQATEIREYEEKIHHLADQMISIDLDDGVKHNYEIFKDVLAKIK